MRNQERTECACLNSLASKAEASSDTEPWVYMFDRPGR